MLHDNTAVNNMLCGSSQKRQQQNSHGNRRTMLVKHAQYR